MSWKLVAELHIVLLQKLNGYVENLSQNEANGETDLEFFVKREEGTFSRVLVTLDRGGSLAPLFLSFGLITPEQAEWVNLKQSSPESGNGVSLISWLQEVLSEAANASRHYDEMKQQNNRLREELEERYGIESIDLGGESYLTSNLQQRHFECLDNFKNVLHEQFGNNECPLRGLSVRLYHPSTIPAVNSGIQDEDGTFRMRNVLMESHIGENGMVHLVSGIDQLRRALGEGCLDFERAQIFSRVEKYWFRRSRELAQELRVLLGVSNVWYNSLSPGELQDFVIWAGEMLQYCRCRGLFLSSSFSFSIVVQSSGEKIGDSPLDHIPTSKILTVRTDCPPELLVSFLESEDAVQAHIASESIQDDDILEEEALRIACEALGAKKLVRICSSYEQGHVVDACARLIEVGNQVRANLDLSNISLAIDDRYDVWDSGVISIPYDFKMSDIEPKLKALLSSDVESVDMNSQAHMPPRMNCVGTKPEHHCKIGKMPIQRFSKKRVMLGRVLQGKCIGFAPNFVR